MTNLRTVAQQALEALEDMLGWQSLAPQTIQEAAKGRAAALRAALAESVQEPVAWKDKTYESLHHQDFGNSIPLYTAPPQRKPLTEDEIALIVADCSASAHRHDDFSFARAIERAHGIGGDV